MAREDLEGDQRFGRGDALDLQHLVGDEIGERFVIGHTQNRDQIIRASDRKDFGNTFELRQFFGDSVDFVVLDCKQDDG